MKNMLIVILMCLLLFPCLVQAAQPESGLTCVEGEDLAISYGQYADCELEQPSDQDAFEFQGTVGDMVRVMPVDYYGPIELYLEIYDPDNTKIVSTWEHNSYSITLGMGGYPALQKTGTYRIVLTDVSFDEADIYRLQLERIPPLTSPDPPSLFYDWQTTDEISHLGDMDFFTFWGEESSGVRIIVYDPSTPPEFYLEIWKPDNTRIIATWDHNTYSVDTPTLDQTGVYLVGILDVSLDEAGEYILELQCNYGDCPECVDDNDGDGYGYPGGADCPYPEQDCNDSNEWIYPTNSNTYCDCQDPYPQGTTEVCTGGVDEDCDGLTDCEDLDDCSSDPACYSGVANAEASVYGPGSVTASGTFNGLTLILIPIGAVVLLSIWRRKR